MKKTVKKETLPEVNPYMAGKFIVVSNVSLVNMVQWD